MQAFAGETLYAVPPVRGAQVQVGQAEDALVSLPLLRSDETATYMSGAVAPDNRPVLCISFTSNAGPGSRLYVANQRRCTFSGVTMLTVDNGVVVGGRQVADGGRLSGCAAGRVPVSAET